MRLHVAAVADRDAPMIPSPPPIKKKREDKLKDINQSCGDR